MISPKTVADIDSLAANHRRNASLPIGTNAAFIKLNQLEQFITRVRNAHPSADTFQINIIRYPLSVKTPDLDVAGNNLSQVSLMFIPVITINEATWAVQNVLDQKAKNGGLIYHITYGFEKDLPAETRKLIKSTYYDYKIIRAIKVEENRRSIWVVNMEDEKYIVTVRVEEGEMEEVQTLQKSL